MQTIAVRAGQHRTDEGEHSEPIFTTSSYVYQSAADAAAVSYTHLTLPTNREV